MHAKVEAKLTGKWRPALATTEHATSSDGLPVVVIDGPAYGPGEIVAVRVTADTPIDVVNRLVDAGYYVLGQPRGKS